MKKNYEIKGMSCGGFISNVKSALFQLPHETEAELQVNPKTAVLTMSKPIDIEQLQTAAGGALYYLRGALKLNFRL